MITLKSRKSIKVVETPIYTHADLEAIQKQWLEEAIVEIEAAYAEAFKMGFQAAKAGREYVEQERGTFLIGLWQRGQFFISHVCDRWNGKVKLVEAVPPHESPAELPNRSEAPDDRPEWA